MKYQIAKSGSHASDIRRIAAGEIKRARKALARNGSPDTAADHIHKARCHLKKIRGLLRLAHSSLGGKTFEAGNIFFRNVARRLRDVRDSVALVEALDNLDRQSFGGNSPSILKRLRQVLVLDARKLSRNISSGAVLAQTASDLDAELKKVKEWKLKKFTRKDAREAWLQARNACHDAAGVAKLDSTDGHLHEWRKRARDLLSITLLLRKLCPDLQEPRHALKQLIDVLGNDHDLVLLQKAILDREKELRSHDGVATLRAELIDFRKNLQSAAFDLNLRCY